MNRLLLTMPLALAVLLAITILAVLLIRVGGLLPMGQLLPIVGLFLGISVGAIVGLVWSAPPTIVCSPHSSLTVSLGCKNAFPRPWN